MSLSPYHIYHDLCQAYFQEQFQLPGVHLFPGLVRECLHRIQDLPNLPGTRQLWPQRMAIRKDSSLNHIVGWHQKEEVKLHLIWMYCSWNLENEVVWTIVIQRDGSKQKTLQMASLVVKDTIDTSCLNKPSDGIETELKVPYFDLETWISLK